jgi:hypothetical protein
MVMDIDREIMMLRRRVTDIENALSEILPNVSPAPARPAPEPLPTAEPPPDEPPPPAPEGQ